MSIISGLALFCHKLLIVGSREQGIQLTRIFQRDLDHPRRVSILIDLSPEQSLRSRIEFRHGARSRSVKSETAFTDSTGQTSCPL